MAACFEFEGKNLQKAVAQACQELNIPESQLKYDVISHGASGIFGLVGYKKAKICVTLPEKEKDEKGKKEKTVEDKQELPKLSPVAIAENQQLSDADSRDSGTDIDQGTDGITRNQAQATGLTGEKEKPEMVGLEALTRFLDAISLDTRTQVKRNGKEISYQVSGGDTAILIGKKGQTLEAMQYLAEKIINKRFQERIRVRLDVEGYLKAREDNLRRLSKKMAAKAKKTGKPVNMGKMNPQDRRTVHITLKQEPGVRTQSKGDGFIRQILIFPKKSPNRRRSNNRA